MTNYQNYHKLRQRAALKCKKTRTTLNKLLERRSQLLEPIEKAKFMERRLEFFKRMRDNTPHPMTQEEFNKSLRNLVNRKLRISYRQIQDTHTFRSKPRRFQFFWVYKDLIMEELNLNPDLKELVLDDRKFEFDPLFIDAMLETNMVHSNQLSHYEKNSSIEYSSIWEMKDAFTDYWSNDKNEKLPLADAMQV